MIKIFGEYNCRCIYRSGKAAASGFIAAGFNEFIMVKGKKQLTPKLKLILQNLKASCKHCKIFITPRVIYKLYRMRAFQALNSKWLLETNHGAECLCRHESWRGFKLV